MREEEGGERVEEERRRVEMKGEEQELSSGAGRRGREGRGEER